MRRNKLLLTVIMLVIALVPTYLIIYQSIVSTGLPDFEKQTAIEVIYSENAEKKTYVHGSDGYRILTTALENLTYLSSLPENVETNARHEIVFIARDGGRSRYYLYGSKTEIAFYLETPQGKFFHLDLPVASLGGRTLAPSMVGFYALKDGGGSPTEGSQKDASTQVLSLSDLSAVRLDGSVLKISAKVYGTGTEPIAEYHALTDIGSHENAVYVNLTVDYKLTETVICRVLYRITLPNDN